MTPPTATDTTSTPIDRSATITLEKQSGGVTDLDGNGTDAGDELAYAFLVTNTGNVTLTDVTVVDPLVGPVDCPTTPIGPGESVTCTATYVLTQSDIDAGEVVNTADDDGHAPDGRHPAERHRLADHAGGGGGLAVAGQAGRRAEREQRRGHHQPTTFVVTNTGSTTLSSVSVDDPLVGPVSCPVDSLAPGESTTCAATYVLLQSDVDNGSVTNTATATGTAPNGDTPEATDSVTTPVTQTPAITLDKQAGVPSGSSAGDTIDYTFLVENTGNVTLTNVGVTDPTVGTVSCLVTTLAPTESVTCTAQYTLTQADIDAGHLANTADASGTPPGALTPPTATDSTDTLLAASPAITLDKQSGGPCGNTAGDTIDYSFVVENTGNVTLTGIVVDDPVVGAVDCPVTTLAPTESTVCTATYTLTQADVDAGHVANTATATGTDPSDTDTSATDDTDTPILAGPAITLDKQAGGPVGQHRGRHDRLQLRGREHRQRDADGDRGRRPAGRGGGLPGDDAGADGVDDVHGDVHADPGRRGRGLGAQHGHRDRAPTPATPTPRRPTARPWTIPASPAMTLDKQAAAPSGNAAGDTIDYSFVVENTGNVTLTGIVVDDPVVGAVDCPVTTLAPTETTTCTATYTLTQADVDSGHVANTATVTGTDPNGTDVDATDSTDTLIPPGPAISLDKQAGVPSGNGAGDTIGYSFVVTNTGNVTLTGIVVDDPLVGAVDCPVTTLAPTESTTCTATYTLTQADVDAGVVDNTATVTGTDPNGTEVDATDTATGRRSPPRRRSRWTSRPAPRRATPRVTRSTTPSWSTTPATYADRDRGGRPVVGTVDCPVTTLAPTRVDDLHGDLHAHRRPTSTPGSGQHRDRDRHRPDRHRRRRPPTPPTP